MAMLVLTHEGLTLKRISLDKLMDKLMDKLSKPDKGEVRIGRNPEADIYIDDKLASQNHARIDIKPATDPQAGPEYYLEDLDSTNHTYVNGEPITRIKLNHEDLIRIGRHVFKFINEYDALGDKTAKLHKSWIPGVYYTKEE